MTLELTKQEAKALRRLLKHVLNNLDDVRIDDWGFATRLIAQLKS